MADRQEIGSKTADAMLAIVAKGLRIWDARIRKDIATISAGGEVKRPCISPKEIAVLASAGLRLAQEYGPTEDDSREEERRRIQEGIMNPKVREAMRVIAKETGQYPGADDDDGTLQ